MKAPISLVLLALAASAAQAQVRPPAPLVATIDGGRRSAPVSRYEYGMFIEPIGNLVARSLWAEMLDDRKFYYPDSVAEAKDAPPPPHCRRSSWRQLSQVAADRRRRCGDHGRDQSVRRHTKRERHDQRLRASRAAAIGARDRQGQAL